MAGPEPNMVSQSVLVMSLLPGESLLEGLEKLMRLHAEAQGISVDVLKAKLKAEAEEAAGKEEQADGRAESDGRGSRRSACHCPFMAPTRVL